MTFMEQRFPTQISLGSTGGPTRKTEIVTLGSGFEERNQVWANSLRTFDIGYGIKTFNDLHTVIAFWEDARGKLHSFRFKDWSDYKSCAPETATASTDQVIGTGDANVKIFPLSKTYGTINPWSRLIKKPVAGTTKIALGGVTQNSGWTIDTTTGLVTFSSAPGNGVSITAGFEFDIPARFDTDSLTIDFQSFKAGEIPSILIKEDRL